MRHARLLTLRALGLGDLLTAVPALRALARAFPAHERILAAPAWQAPLLELVDVPGVGAAVDRLVAAEPLEPLPAGCAETDVAVNLHGRGPESHRLLKRLGARRTIWFAHADVPESAGAPRWRAREHEVERWCRLLEESGIDANPAELRLSRPRSAPSWARGATLIHPGAASAARRWPAERFAAVARAERACGRRVLLTGTRAERPLAYRIASAAGLPRSSVRAGETDVAELAGAVAVAARVLCGDTGVGHLATALGTPRVLLFGPTSPAEWGPPAEDAEQRVLWSGRSGDPHGDRVDAGLLQITPEEVIGALEGLPA